MGVRGLAMGTQLRQQLPLDVRINLYRADIQILVYI